MMMDRISGRILYPVCGRIFNSEPGYPVYVLTTNVYPASLAGNLVGYPISSQILDLVSGTEHQGQLSDPVHPYYAGTYIRL